MQRRLAKSKPLPGRLAFKNELLLLSEYRDGERKAKLGEIRPSTLGELRSVVASKIFSEESKTLSTRTLNISIRELNRHARPEERSIDELIRGIDADLQAAFNIFASQFGSLEDGEGEEEEKEVVDEEGHEDSDDEEERKAEEVVAENSRLEADLQQQIFALKRELEEEGIRAAAHRRDREAEVVAVRAAQESVDRSELSTEVDEARVRALDEDVRRLVVDIENLEAAIGQLHTLSASDED